MRGWAKTASSYNILGQSLQKGRMWQVGAFVQDSWRWKPNFTINAGLRYEVQLPFRALNNSYSFADMDDVFGVTGPGDLTVGSVVTGLGNLYKPGTFQGSPTQYTMLESGTKAFDTDWNNFAPSIGAAWTTGAESGFMRTILGAPGDSVIRGGYNVSYQRGGMSDMTEVYGDNPGILIDATRSTTNGNLGTLPVLFAGGNGNLGAPAIPLTRVYPMAVPSPSSNVRAFDPNIKLPYAGTGTIGIQRKLSQNISLEARYIRTDSYGGWTLRNLSGALNYNEINIVENKFIDEFRVAQANLVANIAAGKGSTFAYTGVARHEPAADLPGEPERVERRDRHVEVHRVGVDQLHPGAVDVRAEPEPADGREQPARQRDLPRELGRRGPAVQLLRGEPGGEQLDRRHQRAQHEVQRDPAHLQPPVRRRLPA